MRTRTRRARAHARAHARVEERGAPLRSTCTCTCHVASPVEAAGGHAHAHPEQARHALARCGPPLAGGRRGGLGGRVHMIPHRNGYMPHRTCMHMYARHLETCSHAHMIPRRWPTSRPGRPRTGGCPSCQVHTSTATAPLRWSAEGCSAKEAGRLEGWMYTHVGV